jgi:hypothetical protein
MADSLVLTVDELRALRRVAALSLPRFVTAADSGAVAVDAAALRGLAARGLVRLTGRAAPDAVRVAESLTRLLAPFSAARLLAEIEVESGGRITHLACAAAADGSATLLTQRDIGLVSVERVQADVGQVLARRCRIDEVTESAGEVRFTVDAETQADADALALAGDGDAAIGTLTAAGVPRRTARSWITAVTGRRLAVAVRVARRLRDHPTGPYEAAELRWLVAGDGTAWRVEPGQTDPADAAAPAYDAEPPPVAVITTAGRTALGADLAGLVGRPTTREAASQ